MTPMLVAATLGVGQVVIEAGLASSGTASPPAASWGTSSATDGIA
jgi:hypothetical protein